MRNLVVIIVVAILLYLLVTWFTRTPSKQVITSLRKYALYGAAALLILLVVTGRMHWLFGIIAGLLPLSQRLFTAWRTINYFRRFTASKQNKYTAQPEQTSSIKTAYFSMSLNHDTGEMTGTILQGKFENQKLNDLSLDQLIDVLSECRTVNDNDSVAVLEAYLDRNYSNGDSDDWRDQYKHDSAEQSQSKLNTDAITDKEAYQILGLQQGASKKDVKEAHRRLMQKFHPDRGGSTYLSVKINQAKDFLLNNKK